MNKCSGIFLLVLFMISNRICSQNLTQTLRGSITDKALQMPVPGAVVQIMNTDLGTVADSDGNFVLEHVPVGTYNLKVSALGFIDNFLNGIILNSGKELVLSISMQSGAIKGKEVVVSTMRKAEVVLNEMSAVSARSFTVEETSRYAASVNDPARMATNFAGVMGGDDGNNQIIIRGNSPTGLLWRMEGLDVPNPNHFAAAGSSAGGISILSAQLLSNSDFVSGAFAAEYGNAMSGVFDLRLRRGNNEQREYTLQAGLLGLNLAAEGPISKNYKGSYLVNYRYSTLSILSKIGINFTPSTTNFQDLSYHFFLPSKRLGNFSFFSFGGLSNQFFNAPKDSTKWKTSSERYSDEFVSNIGMWGITHSKSIGRSSILKTAIGYSLSENAYRRNYTAGDFSLHPVYTQKYVSGKTIINTTLNHKFSKRLLLRTGLIVNHIQFNFNEGGRKDVHQPLEQWVNSKGSTQTLQTFGQIQYKLFESLTFNGGFHFLGLVYNKTSSLEPRASLKWQLNKRHIVSFGLGKHSQMQAWGVYFAEQSINGSLYHPNKNLGFSKAIHYVASHHFTLARNLNIKTEFYYQYLYQIPVSIADSNTFSAINVQSDYVRIPLVNKGKGKNYGVEFSIEKSLSKNFYYLLSLSFYQSKYTASDGSEYNTRYNGNRIFNWVAGKEFTSTGGRRTFGINVKSVYAGGYRTTPIDLSQSIVQDEPVYYQKRAFSEQLPAYFRTDLRVSLKWNRKRATSTLSLDIQNVSNRLNVYDRYYDRDSKSMKTYYQQGIIPVLNYKIEF